MIEKRKNILTYSFTAVFVVIVLCALMLFSFFNPIENKSKIFENELKSVVLQWNNLSLQLESKDLDAYPPIVAERYAKMGLASYRAFESQKNLSNVQKLLLINQLYSNYLSQFYSKLDKIEKDKIRNLHDIILHSILLKINSDTTAIKFIANKIMSQVDQVLLVASNNIKDDALDFKIENDLQFKSATCIYPKWGLEQNPLVINNQLIRCKMPFDNTKLENQINEDALSIYYQSQNPKPEDIWIGEFWSDDLRGLTFSPVGRWISIANQILAKENISSEDLLKLYMNLGVGFYDASLICWYNKYKFNILRPKEYIHQHFDKKWKPLHDAPDFPAYPSGHSIFGGVSSKILENQFGANYYFVDESHKNRTEFVGKSRKYNNLNEMAIENAYSRVLLGVHFKADCEEGLRLGFEIGKIINQNNYYNTLFDSNLTFNHSKHL